MNNIHSFFGKLFKKIVDEEQNNTQLLLILKEVTKLNITKDDIQVRDTVVTIKAHPLVKQEIVLRKKEILKEIEKRTSLRITDLR